MTANKLADPILMEVIGNSFISIAEEMSVTLQKTAYSSIVREALDFSTALFDENGHLLAQSANIPTHLGMMHLTLQEILKNHYPIETLNDNDQIIMNHPYLGASHTPDILLFCPVFHEDSLIGFTGSMCHHVDVGGSAPGSLANNVTDVYQEGLLIPPLKLYARGEPNQAIFSIIESNIRMPGHTMGDLRAQIAANETGKKRFLNIIKKYGIVQVRQIEQELMNYTEKMIRTKLSDLPNGIFISEGHLDDDGIDIDQHIPLKAKVEIKGENIIFDFTECSPQVKGPMNTVWTVVWSVASYVTRCITDPDVLQNEGAFRPIEIRLKKGTILNPIAPAPVGGRHHTVMRLSEICLQALAEAVPDKIPAASHAHATSISLGGLNPNTNGYFVYFELNGGGMGARRTKDGLSGIDVHVGNCMNVPVEAAELEYPLEFSRYELATDSGGAGEFMGGLGIIRELKVLTDNLTLTIRSDAETTNPNGLFGGKNGKPGRKELNPGTEKATPLYRKATKVLLNINDVIHLQTPGSGGYGDPKKRGKEQVYKDWENGYITDETVSDIYRFPLKNQNKEGEKNEV